MLNTEDMYRQPNTHKATRVFSNGAYFFRVTKQHLQLRLMHVENILLIILLLYSRE